MCVCVYCLSLFWTGGVLVKGKLAWRKALCSQTTHLFWASTAHRGKQRRTCLKCWCPLRNGFTQVSASLRVLCNNIITWTHCIETRSNKALLYSNTKDLELNVNSYYPSNIKLPYDVKSLNFKILKQEVLIGTGGGFRPTCNSLGFDRAAGIVWSLIGQLFGKWCAPYWHLVLSPLGQRNWTWSLQWHQRTEHLKAKGKI